MLLESERGATNRERGIPPAARLDLVGLYFDDVGKGPLLSAEDEVRLAKVIETGKQSEMTLSDGPRDRRTRLKLQKAVREGVQARTEFTLANLRLVIAIAKRTHRRGIALLDAVQDGNIGLLRAVDRFDWRHGVRFSTYAAPWIQNAIVTAGREAASPIHLPRVRRRELALLAETADRLEHETGSRPGLQDLSAATGIAVDEIAWLRRAAGPMTSLQAPVTESGSELNEVIADPSPDVAELVAARHASDELEPLLAQLPGSGAQVLRLRYGIGSGEPRTAKEVAALLSVSPERISQIERRALLQLEHHVQNRRRTS